MAGRARRRLPNDHYYPLLMSEVEAASYLGVGRDRLRQLVKSGEIPSVRLGGLVRISRYALEDWVRGLNGPSAV